MRSREYRFSDPIINDVEENFYRLNKDYTMTAGKAAPWFNSSGGAEQIVVYKTINKKEKYMLKNILKWVEFPISYIEDKGGTIFYQDSTYPLEHAIMNRTEENESVVYEIQRDKLYELYRTNKFIEAEVYTALFIKKIFRKQDDNGQNIIDEYIKNNTVEDIISYFDKLGLSNYYSLCQSDNNKLVLLINDGVASIVFNHKVIPYAENIDIKDALSFLYSLIEEMKYILDFYNNLSEAEKSSIDFVEFAYKFIEI